jgi:hypothetical protein
MTNEYSKEDLTKKRLVVQVVMANDTEEELLAASHLYILLTIGFTNFPAMEFFTTFLHLFAILLILLDNLLTPINFPGNFLPWTF